MNDHRRLAAIVLEYRSQGGALIPTPWGVRAPTEMLPREFDLEFVFCPGVYPGVVVPKVPPPP